MKLGVSIQFSKNSTFIDSIFLATHGNVWDGRQISVKAAYTK